MKLHGTAIQKVLRLLDLHGGKRDNKDLVNELKKLDLSVYSPQNNQSILVLTEELQKQVELQKQNRR